MSGEQQQGCLSGKKKFKILSIDGGGIRGIIPCKLLTDLESELMKRDGENARLADYFDLYSKRNGLRISQTKVESQK